MYAGMAEAVEQAQADAAVRVMVIQGHETVFSAGNDIADFLQAPPTTLEAPVFRFMRAISSFSKPSWRRCAGRRWASAPRCCSIATWSMPVTTPLFPCPL